MLLLLFAAQEVATAEGDTLVSSVSLIAGVASGEQITQTQPGGGGYGFSIPSRLLGLPPRLFVQDAQAKGGLVSAQTRLIAGRAVGGASTAGAIVALPRLILIEGKSFGDAILKVQPVAHIARVDVLQGGASGECNLSDEELFILAEAA